MAREKLVIDPLHLRMVEDMAGRGAILDDIACVIGISPRTLDRWLKHEDVRFAYKRGRAIAKDNIARTPYQKAMEGDTIAMIFWLKAQGGWSDKQVDIPPDMPEVEIYIPKRQAIGPE